MKKIYIILSIPFLAYCFIGCQEKQTIPELEKFRDQIAIEERNIKIINLYVDKILNKGNLAVADSIIGEEFVDPASGSGEKGPESLKKVISYFRSVFPDLKITIDGIVSDKDIIAWRWTAIGTHQGEILGIPPSNKKVTFSGIIFDKIINGKIVCRQGIWDRMGLKERLLEK